jgi:hypothetical protein
VNGRDKAQKGLVSILNDCTDRVQQDFHTAERGQSCPHERRFDANGSDDGERSIGQDTFAGGTGDADRSVHAPLML